jgi:outer membrane PBP1 activator LpoA protein
MPHRIALVSWRRVWAIAHASASGERDGTRAGRRAAFARLLALAAAAAAAAPSPAPAIAALLPLEGPVFGRAAAAVQAGLSAAATLSAPADRPPLAFVATGERPADILPAYSKALALGARVVIGPLIRDQVSALAAGLAAQPPVNVPTIALNVPETPTLPQNLFAFGLPAEDEARQVARAALAEGHRRAAVLSQAGLFPRRLQEAFTDSFTAGGGQVAIVVAAATEASGLPRLAKAVVAARPDLLFIACDLPHARLVRPFIEPRLPTYATSHLWSGAIDPGVAHDLDGTRMPEAPWLVSPDHAAVMVYARSQPPLPPELERLYALGIDAWRLGEIALRAGTLSGATLDGVTGRLEVAADRRVRREAPLARLRQGRLEPAPPPR